MDALRLVIVTIYNFNHYCLLVAATHHGISRTRNGVNISPRLRLSTLYYICSISSSKSISYVIYRYNNLLFFGLL